MLRIYLFIPIGSVDCYLGDVKVLKPSGDIDLVSEFTFPPLGYYLDMEPSEAKDLFDITHYANNYDYGQCSDIRVQLPVHFRNTIMPGDFRSVPEILRDKGYI